MRVGLTYDLRDDHLALGRTPEEVAELDSPATIDAIEGALRELGHSTVRIGHVRALVERLAAGERWDLVFNVAEGLSGYGREAQVPALLEAYEIPCVFSDPLVCALTLHKAMCKRVLRDAGLPTPDFALVSTPAEAASVALPFPLFAKPVAEGTSKGIDAGSRVDDPTALERVCVRLLERFAQPVLVERFLPGRELTVGIVGTGTRAHALGALEVTLPGASGPAIYGFREKEAWSEHVSYRLARGPLAEEACTLALAAWRLLGARDGGRVDLRADGEGRLQLLEVNPLPGLKPAHSDLPLLATEVGMGYLELIGRIVGSAHERVRSRA